MATQTLDEKGNIIVNGFSTNQTPAQYSNSNIPVSSIAPASPFNLPAPQSNASLYSSVVPGVQADIAGGLSSAQLQADQAAAQAEQARSGGVSLANLLAGAEASNVKDVAGVYGSTNLVPGGRSVNDLFNQVSDINARATGLNLERQGIPTAVTEANAQAGRVTTTGVAQGQTEQALRQNALKALALGQEYAIASGNYEKARNYADQLIDTKFAQETARINALKTQLDALDKYTLSPAQEKAKDAQQRVLEKEKQQVEEAKLQEQRSYTEKIDLQKNLDALKNQIIQNGGDPTILNGATSVADALNMGMSALRTPNTEIVKLGDNQAYLIDKNTGKIIKSFGSSFGASGGGISPTSPYAGALSTILASGKFTKDQTAAITRAINSGEDPVTVIKNNAKSILGATEAGKLGNYEVAKSTMTDLQNSLSEFYKNGGKTSYLSGNYENVVNKLGEVKDPRLVELAVQIQSQLQVYRNAVSGTAYSVQEGADIASVFPGINKSQGLNESIIKGRQKAFDSTIDGFYKTAIGDKAYNSLKEATSPANLGKGNLDDRSFVARSVQAQPYKYEDIVNNVPAGSIPVVNNDTGGIEYLPIAEYNSTKYTKL